MVMQGVDMVALLNNHDGVGQVLHIATDFKLFSALASGEGHKGHAQGTEAAGNTFCLDFHFHYV